MAIALVIPALLGALIHRRLSARSAWYDVLGTALAIGLFALSMGVNCGLRAGLSLGWAAGLASLFFAVACLPLLLRRPLKVEQRAPRAARWVQLLLAALLLLSVYQVTLQRQQILAPDYAVGATTQGLLLNEHPPFLLGDGLGGELDLAELSYGADLTVAVWAKLGGIDIFSAQGDLTVLAVVGTLLLLFAAAQRSSRSYPAALLTTALCAFGLGPGLSLLEVSSPRYWLGLLLFATLLKASVLLQEQPSVPRALFFGGALAASTTFSPALLPLALLLLILLGLAVLLRTLLGVATSSIRSSLPLWGLACTVAFTAAATQNHPAAHLAAAERVFTLWLPELSALPWVALSGALWLFLLLRVKSPAVAGGGLFLLTGALLAAPSTPEAPIPTESLPWAAVLQTTSLWLMGLALGGSAWRAQQTSYRLGALLGGRLLLTRAGVGASLALLVLTAAAVQHSGSLTRLRSERPQAPPYPTDLFSGVSRGERWLANHPQLLLDPGELEAFSWLRGRRTPGAKVLFSPSEDPLSPELFFPTFTGLTGLTASGRESPAAAELSRQFWLQPSLETLSLLDPDWLYYRSDEGIEPPPFPGATVARRFRTEGRIRLLYRIDRVLLEEQRLALERLDDPGESPCSPLAFEVGRPLTAAAPGGEP